jgi:Flp pilus assembly protein TadD
MTRAKAWQQAAALHRENRLPEAERLYRAILKTDPNNPHVLRRLGAVLLQQGRDAEALTFLAAVCSVLPDDVNAWNQQGLALSRLERFDEAHQCYLKAIELSPNNPRLLANIGASLIRAERFRDGLPWLRRALKSAPGVAEVKINLASALVGLEQESAARRLLEAVIGEGHRSVEAMQAYGAVLRRAGETEAALAVLQEALKLKPDHTEVLVLMGNALLDEGRFGEAQTLLERALALKPKMPQAWAALALTRKMTPQDRPWLDTAELLLQGNLPPRRAVQLLHAMGKFCDDLQDFERAFGYYRRANELKKGGGGVYDRQEQTARFDRLIAAYNRTVVKQVRAGSSDSRLPVFIVGMPRSGTSLTEQIIASHPAAFGAGELLFWGEQVKRHENVYLSAAYEPSLLAGLAAAALDNLRQRAPEAARVTDKMPGNFIHLGFIHAVFPQARILHVHRHPIDTCLSIFFQNFNNHHAFAADLEDLAHCYREYHRLMDHWRTVLPSEIFLDVPYEGLVDDHEGWSRRIIEFIGLEWDARCLDFHLTERRVGTPSNWQARQKIYKTSKERWRNYEKFVGPLLPLLDLYQPAK